MTNKNILTRGSVLCAMADGGKKLLNLCEEFAEKATEENRSPFEPIPQEDLKLIQKTIENIITDITTPKNPINALFSFASRINEDKPNTTQNK